MKRRNSYLQKQTITHQLIEKLKLFPRYCISTPGNIRKQQNLLMFSEGRERMLQKQTG